MFAIMFFLLSKFLDFIINPFYWVLVLMIIGMVLLWKRKKGAAKWLMSSLFLSLFFTSPIIMSIVMNAWQTPAFSSKNIRQPYRIGILMGGSMRYFDEQNQRPVYSMSVDRLLQTIALYKEGKIEKILLTGGSGFVFMQHQKEAYFIAEVLRQSGIPDSNIISEDQSRNTYENAIFTRDILQQKNISGRCLLITSAFHMRRSLACFNKAGLKVDPFPVDSKTRKLTFTPDSFLPEPFYFTLWNQLVHEWIGMVAYKISGYI